MFSSNNLSLSDIPIQLKTFVKEKGESISQIEKSKKSKVKLDISDAHIIYEEIISQKSSKQTPDKILELKNKNKVKSFQINKNKNLEVHNVNVNSLFKAIETGEKNFVYKNFNSKNVNICDQFGWTPLMAAACSGNEEIVRFLLKTGACTKIKDKSGLTAIDLALKKNYLDIVNVLKQNIRKKKKEISKNKKPIDELEEKTSTSKQFYCDVCQISILESSKKTHKTSTLHIFNSNPKLNNCFYGIPKQNKGYQMLLSTGWNEEGGLGPSGEGQKYPVKTVLKRDRKGLGLSNKETARITHFNAKDPNAIKSVIKNKKKIFKKKDLEKQLSREAEKTRTLRRALA